MLKKSADEGDESAKAKLAELEGEHACFTSAL